MMKEDRRERGEREKKMKDRGMERRESNEREERALTLCPYTE